MTAKAANTASGNQGSLTGTWRLVRLVTRRERVLLPVWIAVVVTLLVGSAAAMVGLYPTAADRMAYAAVSANMILARMFDGPIMGTSLGAIVIVEVYAVLAVLVGIMNVLTVVRHTRTEEETGRAELVGAAAVGRFAPLSAVLVVTGAANLLLGAAVAIALRAIDLPLSGSVAAGAAVAGVGAAFAATAAVTAQVFSSHRGANAMGMAVIGVAFLVRAVGDGFGSVTQDGLTVVSAWPSWLSPIGWGHQVRAFAGERWWVLALYAALVAILVVVGLWLRARRDLGAGLVQVRPGPASGSPRLRSPLGLAWRLQRWVFVAWLVGLVLFTAMIGSIAHEAEELLATSDELAALLAALGVGEIVDQFFAFFMGLLAVVAAGFTVQSLLRARSEEAGGTGEPVLVTGVGRTRWLGSHAVVAVAGTIVILCLAAFAGGLAHLAASGDGGAVGSLLAAALVNSSAVLALGGFVIAVIGLLPRWALPVGWAALLAALVVGQFGDLFGLPQAILNVSPFTHPPAVPAQELVWMPILALLAAAAGLTAVGLAAFRRRDLAV